MRNNQRRWRPGGQQRQSGWRQQRQSGWRQQRQRVRENAHLVQAWRELLEDVEETAATALPGRYEGSVTRESDGSTFLRAIELGAVSGNKQSIRVFDQVGGQLPATPQHAGDGFAIGASMVFFAATDGVADRKFLCFVLGNMMLSFSISTYHDGRPDVKLGGVLRMQ